MSMDNNSAMNTSNRQNYQRHGRTTSIDDHSDLQVLRRIKRHLLPKDFTISPALLAEIVAGYDIGDPIADRLAADGIRFKPFEPRELLARIRAVIRRHEQPNQAESQSDSLTFGRLSVFPDSHEVTIDEQPVRLTTHQFQLLHYFATHSGKVLNREQLWQAMPNDDSSDNIDRAIDVHISRLRALIEDNPRQPKRIITVRGVGYQFATDQV